ncbi:MAG: hypothetical protein GC147_08170 [Porphyrobacter sp.]|nr:hypothetical protein [Porphyrobacter sp.]
MRPVVVPARCFFFRHDSAMARNAAAGKGRRGPGGPADLSHALKQNCVGIFT